MLPTYTTISSKGRLLSLQTPIVMGILNATPNSFFNKGQDSDNQGLLSTASKMLNEGATILDVGGASTKPGEPLIDTITECGRVVPAIAAIRQQWPDAWISVDTYNSTTAKAAVEAGADIVNDVSGGRFDPAMLATVAALQVPYIAMHMQGTPANMQLAPTYTDVVAEVRDYLRTLCEACTDLGIKDIIIDPGYGFGKTLQHNYQLLVGQHTLGILGRPVLAGLSRKSIVCRALGVSPQDALNGTTALNMVALQQGAKILRVHDVKEAAEVVRLYRIIEELN